MSSNTPAAPPGFNVITEGQANVLVPKGNKVFYNNVQEFNRDLSICVLSNYGAIRIAEFEEKAQKWLSGADERAKKRAKKSDEPVETTAAPLTMDDVPDRLKYKGLRIFEALSASGLRSIRYFKEIPNVDTIHVNDMDPSAVASIQRNIRFNGLPLDRVIPNQNDATAALYLNRARVKEMMNQTKAKPVQATTDVPTEMLVPADDPLAWLYQPAPPVKSLCPTVDMPSWDVIDLDPYGSATPFLDAAIQAVESGGILCVTCTDSGVLCGNHSETCFAKYDAMPLKGAQCHEAALRILLHTVESVAARYQRTITPLLSLSIDFYVRIFFRVNTSALGAKFSASKQSLVYSCVRCGSFHPQRVGKNSNDNLQPGEPRVKSEACKFTAGNLSIDQRCKFCSGAMKLSGPMWSDPLHDPAFARRCLEYVRDNKDKFGTAARLMGMLEMAANELPVMLSYSPSHMTNVLHTSTPRNAAIFSALANAGYKVSETHSQVGNFKTDAPIEFIWDIFRAHVASLPQNELPSTMTLSRAALGAAGVILENGKEMEYTEEEKASVGAVAVRSMQQVREEESTAPGVLILSQPTTHKINFQIVKNAYKKIVMFYPNPEDHWGPKAAAGIFARDINLSGQDAGMNAAQALGKAQHEKAMALQNRRGKRKSDEQEQEQDQEQEQEKQ